VVLVDHDLQSQIVGSAPQVKIHVIQVGAFGRVVMPVRQVDPNGLVRVCIGEIWIGVFGKEPGLHGVALTLW
jgi:hypothetical protein